MDTNKQGTKGKRSQTGVSDEVYDLMVSLTNTLQELWRLDEFIADESRSRDRAMWQTIQNHDREAVDLLLTELKRELGDQGGSGSK